MKKFLIISGSFLGLALLITIAVYYYVSFQLLPTSVEKSTPQTAPAVPINTATNSTPTPPPASGIPLKDLPLSDSQTAVLEKVGVDVDTFVITPAMQTCAAEKLGADRMNDIMGGAAPTTLETAKLLPCLGGK